MPDPVHNSETGTDAHIDPDLRPVILEQKATHAIVVLFLLLGAALSASGLPLFSVTLPGQMRIGPPQICLGAVFILGSIACVVGALRKLWRDRGFTLYLHTGGIRERRAWGDSVVLFREVDELKFQATRVFVHGAYGGTVEHLAVGMSGSEDRGLYFQRKRQEFGKGKAPGEASEVAQIAMRIAGAIAENMVARLVKKETLPWTPRMRLNLAGVEIEQQRWWERDLRDMAKSIVGWFRWTDGPRGAWPHLPWNQIDPDDDRERDFPAVGRRGTAPPDRNLDWRTKLPSRIYRRNATPSAGSHQQHGSAEIVFIRLRRNPDGGVPTRPEFRRHTRRDLLHGVAVFGHSLSNQMPLRPHLWPDEFPKASSMIFAHMLAKMVPKRETMCGDVRMLATRQDHLHDSRPASGPPEPAAWHAAATSRHRPHASHRPLPAARLPPYRRAWPNREGHSGAMRRAVPIEWWMHFTACDARLCSCVSRVPG